MLPNNAAMKFRMTDLQCSILIRSFRIQNICDSQWTAFIAVLSWQTETLCRILFGFESWKFIMHSVDLQRIFYCEIRIKNNNVQPPLCLSVSPQCTNYPETFRGLFDNLPRKSMCHERTPTICKNEKFLYLFILPSACVPAWNNYVDTGRVFTKLF
jgi:hypothetical protein